MHGRVIFAGAGIGERSHLLKKSGGLQGSWSMRPNPAAIPWPRFAGPLGR